MVYEMELPAQYSFQRKVDLLAAHYDNITEPGHGIFFEFRNCSDLEAPLLRKLQDQYGWMLEKSFFIRKPED